MGNSNVRPKAQTRLSVSSPKLNFGPMCSSEKPLLPVMPACGLATSVKYQPEALDDQADVARQGDATLEVQDELVAAAEDRVGVRRRFPHEDRPELGEGPRILEVARVGDRRQDVVEAVRRLERGPTGVAGEAAAHALGDVGPGAAEAVAHPIEERALVGVVVDAAAVVGFLVGLGPTADRTGARRGGRPRRRRRSCRALQETAAAADSRGTGRG